jgi:hypothetical protein
MKLHTDTINRNDIINVLMDTGLRADGVYIDTCDEKRSHSHSHGFEIRLRGMDGKDRNDNTRRLPMYSWKTGNTEKAATYDEWGIFISALYEIDPDARFGPYLNEADFHGKTRYQF